MLATNLDFDNEMVNGLRGVVTAFEKDTSPCLKEAT